MTTTQTGNFPIGFRRGWSEWQRDLAGLIGYAKNAGFAALDLGNDAPGQIKPILDAGLRLGSVDLRPWKELGSPDAVKRSEGVAIAIQYIEDCVAEAGAGLNFFVVIMPEDASRERAENLKFAAESYTQLAPVLEKSGSKAVIEGWPGPGVLCCTPESCRAFFSVVDSPAVGINYDPSHLIRMGIDPIRFLREFGHRVFHVHAKDTAINQEALYEYGWEQPATLASPHEFGRQMWRYTIPGHGQTPWVEVFRELVRIGYRGCVCVELEDENFNGTEEGEKRGLETSKTLLASA